MSRLVRDNLLEDTLFNKTLNSEWLNRSLLAEVKLDDGYNEYGLKFLSIQ